MPIATLSSIPPRFDKIGPTLTSLLRQSLPFDRIIIYIPETYKRFPNWDGTLPVVPQGVEIRRCAKDLGPATKILPAARDFAGTDTQLILCDDDRAYGRNWAARLAAVAKTSPGEAIAGLGLHTHWIENIRSLKRRLPRAKRRWRITDAEFQLRLLARQLTARATGQPMTEPGRRVFRRSGYVDIFEGCGGVLVRPEMFDETACNIPDLAWSVDDVWLSGMLARHGIPIWVTANMREPELTEAEAFEPLVTSAVGGTTRNDANRATVQYLRNTYGIWP